MKRTGLFVGAACLCLSLAVPAWAGDCQKNCDCGKTCTACQDKTCKTGVVVHKTSPFLYAVSWQQHSAEIKALCCQTYNTATAVMRDKVRMGNYVKRDGRLYKDSLVVAPDGKTFVESKPVAIALDLDETVFDNSAYEAWSTLQPGPYDNGYWTKFCEFQSVTPAAQRAMPGAVEFLKQCMEWGITPLYITNRDMPDREFTLSTLRGMGLDSPILEEQLISRDKSKLKQQAQDLADGLGVSGNDALAVELLHNASDKAGRRRVLETKYEVIGYFGDNLYDFPVVVDADLRGKEAQKARNAQVYDNAARWGVDWFMVPNVTYGSWVKPVIYPHKSKSAREMLDDDGFGAWLKETKFKR